MLAAEDTTYNRKISESEAIFRMPFLNPRPLDTTRSPCIT